MTATTLAAFIALVGPPASGKRTVAAGLCSRRHGQVFQLREVARRGRRDGWLAPPSPLTGREVDGLSPESVDAVLHEALLQGRFPAGEVVVFEGFPTTADQLHSLRRLAVLRGVPLMVLELGTAEDVLVGRALARRVCPTCEPDPDGDPRQPAQAAHDNPNRCGVCRQILVLRRCDNPTRFARRLQSYWQDRPQIRQAASSFGIPWRPVDASGQSSDVVNAAQQLMQELLPPAAVAMPG